MTNSLRSLLFVPADRHEKIRKALGLAADAVILDLEDGVAESQKGAAREQLRRLPAGPAPSAGPALLVRINAEPDEQRQDLDVAVHPRVSGLVLPKSQAPKEIRRIAEEVGALEQGRGISNDSVRLLLLIESARGLLEVASLAAASDRVAALLFGAEDWCLDMGIERTRAGRELEWARWTIAVCARAHGLAAIDTIFADFRDTQGLLRDTEAARRIGLTGKLAIHPGQLAPIHSVFAPSAAEIAEAEAIVAAFDRALTQGLGAVAVNGRMIDKPVAQRARQLLARVPRTP